MGREDKFKVSCELRYPIFTCASPPQVAPAIKHLQEAMRNDPDNSGYRTEIKKWRSMEAQKEAGNDAFKKGNFQEVN